MIKPAKRQAYDVTIRRLATGADYSVRLFCVDAAAAEEAAIGRFLRATGMTASRLGELNAKGIAMFRVISCELSADQSRPVIS